MSKKRKDSKGCVLKSGESQRKDLIYQYRYTDLKGKRHTIYSSDLHELRQKEAEIQKILSDGIEYAAGQITVIDLLEKHIGLKQGVRYNKCDIPIPNTMMNTLCFWKPVCVLVSSAD